MEEAHNIIMDSQHIEKVDIDIDCMAMGLKTIIPTLMAGIDRSLAGISNIIICLTRPHPAFRIESLVKVLQLYQFFIREAQLYHVLVWVNCHQM